MGALYDKTWGRGFAAVYDRVLNASEEAGLGDMRRELLSSASGDVIDIGAGTGVNLDAFPASVTRLVMAEPFPPMAQQLRERAAEAGREVEVSEAPAESLPFPDDSFDYAVFTLVLCTVDEPDAALAEAARVLRPGGRMLFLEHVRSDNPRLAKWQDRLHGAWHFAAVGCHTNRDTAASIRQSEFQVETIEDGEFPKSLPITKPLIRGSARLPA